MNEHENDRISKLLRQAVTPVGDAEPRRDLWPQMLARTDAAGQAPPWFDWALAVAVLAFVALVPALIPVLLYYL